MSASQAEDTDQSFQCKQVEVHAMTEQMGVAILGCGYWGINYVRVFNELPNS